MPGPRILIADDDADLRALLSQRLEAEGFEVLQAADGAEALRLLEFESPAVAFLDVNMPAFTGLQVCERARKSAWGGRIPLLVLTSLSDPSTVDRAMRAGATGYLLKPPRVEDVLAEVRRLAGPDRAPLPPEAPGEGEITPKMEALLEQVGTLPAVPMVTRKLIEVLNNPSAGARELSKVISLDPAITAQVLRLANSAYYGQAGKVSDVTKAVILIGFAEISHTLMALSLANLFVRRDGAEVLDRQSFWEHALGCSVVAHHLAVRAGLPDPNRALVAGLLHDLGKLVMAYYLPDDYASILRRARVERRHTRDVEREILGDNHSLVGQALAKRWKLPPGIYRSIRYHHVPLSVESLDYDVVSLVRVVSAADGLCKAAGLGSSGDDLVEEVPERIWNLLGVDQKAAEAAVEAGRETIAVHKAVLTTRKDPGAKAEAAPAVLHFLETDQAVAMSRFSLQAAGFSPLLARSWGEGAEVLEGKAPPAAVVVEASSGPTESRLLETFLKWRGGRPRPGALFLAPGRRLAGLPVEPGLVGFPKPLGIAGLRTAMAALAGPAGSAS